MTIQSFLSNPECIFTQNRILELIGICKTPFYLYTHEERYGLSVEERDALDEPYVRQAFEYKGFRKGSRLVYMLIPKLSGRKIGIDRVRRIMRKYGMESKIRRPNAHREGSRKYLEEARKPNLLRRMFRLHRPNEVRITDVTYLEYGP